MRKNTTKGRRVTKSVSGKGIIVYSAEALGGVPEDPSATSFVYS